MKKRVLGISFGRKLSNCDVMVKRALMTCEAEGCDVQFIRADELNIGNCTGCVSCMQDLFAHNGRNSCYQKDDMDMLDDAVMKSDAVILACPTYETSVTGRFKTICDRIGPSRSQTYRHVCTEIGKERGLPEEQLPDQRAFKKRTAALISVGGAMTENWICLTMPMMYEFTFPYGIDVIDTEEYYAAMKIQNIVANEPMMERMKEIGHHIVESINADSEEERIRWRGKKEGICPVCHCRLLQVNGDGLSVDCAVCGSHGELAVENGTIKVRFSQEEQDRSRLRWKGSMEHILEIRDHAFVPGMIPDLKERLKPYQNYASEPFRDE